MPEAAPANQTPLLYPTVEPYERGSMDTGDGHQIYLEQCGNPQGLPVVILHGGPASGCSPLQRRLFDPDVFRIVLFDQRGCGRSTPRGSLTNNHTEALIGDIEQLRKQLRIERWIVFGGSWGASLAIAYAASHPTACLGIILRGTFLTGARDLQWFFGGAGALVPAAWKELVTQIGLTLAIEECEHAGHAVLTTLKRQLFSDTPAVAGAAAAAWARWEDAVSRPGVDSGSEGQTTPRASAPAPQQELIDKYRVQAHYLEHHCFLGEDVLLRKAAELAPSGGPAQRLTLPRRFAPSLREGTSPPSGGRAEGSAPPVQIVHGRLDWVCRPANAWQVHRAIPGSTLAWADHGGHNPYEPPMLGLLFRAIDAIRQAAI